MNGSAVGELLGSLRCPAAEPVERLIGNHHETDFSIDAYYIHSVVE